MWVCMYLLTVHPHRIMHIWIDWYTGLPEPLQFLTECGLHSSHCTCTFQKHYFACAFMYCHILCRVMYQYVYIETVQLSGRPKSCLRHPCMSGQARDLNGATVYSQFTYRYDHFAYNILKTGFCQNCACMVRTANRNYVERIDKHTMDEEQTDW